jgi:hypothetical protein
LVDVTLLFVVEVPRAFTVQVAVLALTPLRISRYG